eukprot:scaffold44957_cov41-Phaeocystis_antarctica.AAC.1
MLKLASGRAGRGRVLLPAEAYRMGVRASTFQPDPVGPGTVIQRTHLKTSHRSHRATPQRLTLPTAAPYP